MHSRGLYLRSLLKEGIWTRWISVVWLAYGVAAAYKAEVLSSVDQERYQLVKMIPSISFGWWMAILFFTLLLVAFESSFRIHHRALCENATLTNRLADKRNRLKIRTALGAFAEEARQFMLEDDDELKPMREADRAAWQKKVESYILRELDPEYLAQFRSPGETQILPSGLSERQKSKEGMKFRNKNLLDIIKELRD